MADAKRGKMHASASQLALVLLLIGWKGGANLLSQSHRVESAKPITFRHSNENRSIRLLKMFKKSGTKMLKAFKLLQHAKQWKRPTSAGNMEISNVIVFGRPSILLAMDFSRNVKRPWKFPTSFYSKWKNHGNFQRRLGKSCYHQFTRTLLNNVWRN